MLDDADEELLYGASPLVIAEEQDKYRDSAGLVMPFEFVCLSCSSQGVRVVIPPGGVCSRCQPHALNRTTSARAAERFGRRAEPQPVGVWCLGGIAGPTAPEYRRPGFLLRAWRRAKYGDRWLDAAP